MDEQMVSTFMEITACESQAYAVQHLGSCRWKLDEAIDLYFNSGGGGGAGPSAVSAPIPPEEEVAMKEEDDGVRAPIPSRVEALYEDDAFYYGNHDAPYIAPYIEFGKEPYPAPPVPALFHAQALSEIEESTGRGVEAELIKIAATGWGEPEPGDGGHVGAEDIGGGGGGGGGESRNDAEQEDNNSCSEDDSDDKDDDDNMIYSDNEVEDYGFEMEEDDTSYYATEDAGEQPRPAQPQQQKHSLVALFERPLDLMFDGSFHDAKVHAAGEDRFLLVNLQALDFQSMLYNRDLWSDEQVKNAVKESFVLFLDQKSTDNHHYMDQCSKVCSFYRLEDDQLPAVLVLDPITGQLLNKWSGPMTPHEFMQYVDAYTKEKPSTMSMPKFVKRTPAPAVVAAGEQEPASSSASAAAAVVEQEPVATENSKPAATEAGEQEPEILPENAAHAGASEQEPVPAPEAEPAAEMMVDDDDEPIEGEKMYKLRIRFPDGTMVSKEFGCKRKVASLFTFCSSAVRGGGEAVAEQKAFRIMRFGFAGHGFEAVQGDDGGATFEDLALNYATVSVVFDT